MNFVLTCMICRMRCLVVLVSIAINSAASHTHTSDMNYQITMAQHGLKDWMHARAAFESLAEGKGLVANEFCSLSYVETLFYVRPRIRRAKKPTLLAAAMPFLPPATICSA